MHQNKFFIMGAGVHPKASEGTYLKGYAAPKTRTLVSLFSGAMGLDLGLEAAGFDLAGCLEFNHEACETIRLNKPGLPLVEGDIREWNGPRVLAAFGCRAEDVLCVCGGPPCPSFSTAGKRQSFNDPRGEVMFDYLRIVEEIRPPFFVMENVRGILSAALAHEKSSSAESRTGKAEYGTVLRELNKRFAEMGYTVTAELVNAANYGVPQKRERVIFLGSRDGFQMSMPAGGFSETADDFHAPWRTIRDAFHGLREEEAEFIPYNPGRARFFELLGPGQNWRDLPENLQREALGGAWNSTGGRVGFYRRLAWDEPSPTVPTSPIQKSTALCHPAQVRPLSVQEYARIQQFPDNWRIFGKTEDKYRQIGNAVPVGLGYAIGKTVLKYAANYYPMEEV